MSNYANCNVTAGTTVFERNPPSEELVSDSLANTAHRPFWTDNVPGRVSYPACDGEHHADLTIVGGGFLGLWTAILAKERYPTRKVFLLEGEQVGWAASGRNGGFCEASLTHGEKNGQRRWPEEFAQLQELGRQNLDEIEQTINRYQIDCDFERTGILAVAVEPYQVEQLRGPGFLSRDEVRAQVNSPTFLAGHWDQEGSAMLHPGKLAVGLARAASSLGVQIFERSPVVKLKAGATSVELATPAGRIQTNCTVLATNAFPSLLRRYRWHTLPVYDYVLMTEPMTAAQLNSVGWRNRQGMADLGNQFHYYRLTRDQRILFGGYDAIYHFGGKLHSSYEDRPESFRKLASHFFTTFPQLAGLRFSHRWAGAIDVSTRFCAFFAQAHGGRVHYSAGFTGLGVGATRFAANVLLDKAERRDTERTRLRMVRQVPMPFPPEPLVYPTIQTTRWALDRADGNEGKRNILLRTMDVLGLGFDS